MLLTLADNGQLRGMVFWLAGRPELGAATRRELVALASALTVVARSLGRWLNVLGAGELRSATRRAAGRRRAPGGVSAQRGADRDWP